MKFAIWIIAICEVIRALQNMVQLVHVKKSEKMSANAYQEFIKSLQKTDREFVRDMLEEYEKAESEDQDGQTND